MSALSELQEYLEDSEQVEGIVFGAWGGKSARGELGNVLNSYDEPDPPPVPLDKRSKVLSLEEAAPYMGSWSFYNGYAATNCYATYVWTNKRVIWVTQYDGATELGSAPRNPSETMPDMPGAVDPD